jgi:hypothetical protein
MDQKHPEECDIYGCRNKKLPGEQSVTVTIGEETVELHLCDFHFDFLEQADPGLYDIGFTYRRDVEIRLKPVSSTPPSE